MKRIDAQSASYNNLRQVPLTYLGSDKKLSHFVWILRYERTYQNLLDLVHLKSLLLLNLQELSLGPEVFTQLLCMLLAHFLDTIIAEVFILGQSFNMFRELL